MKRLFIAIAFICTVLIMSMPLYGQTPSLSSSCVSSGLSSTSQEVVAGPVRFLDLAIYTDGTHNVTVTCYDNASTNSGNVIAQASATGAGLVGDDFAAVAPRQASAGIYCTISGTGGSYIVYYDNLYNTY